MHLNPEDREQLIKEKERRPRTSIELYSSSDKKLMKDLNDMTNLSPSATQSTAFDSFCFVTDLSQKIESKRKDWVLRKTLGDYVKPKVSTNYIQKRRFIRPTV